MKRQEYNPSLTSRIPDRAIRVVLENYELTLRQITSKGRHHHLVDARRMVVWLLTKHTAMTLGEIGAMLGNRDHSTIIYMRDGAAERISQDGRWAKFAREIEKEVIDDAPPEWTGTGQEDTVAPTWQA